MTVKQILDRVYREYEKDADYLEFTDDDMVLWFDYLKDSLKEWVDEFQDLREVYTELSLATDGDKTTVSGQSDYDAPTNFIRPATFIKVGNNVYHYLPIEKTEYQKENYPDERWFSVKGYKGAFKIVIYPTPSTTGTTISYPYYKTITEPTGENSTVEITRPNYCVYYILRQLYLDDPINQNLAKEYEAKMIEEVRREKIERIRAVTGQRLKADDIYGSGIGEKYTPDK